MRLDTNWFRWEPEKRYASLRRTQAAAISSNAADGNEEQL